MIGPRLIDPKKYSNQLLDRFRYAEEKKIVQDILKARAVTQNSNIYASKKPNIGRNPGQKRPNRSNSPTNPVATPMKTPSVDILPPVSANPPPVVATPEKILLPSVEIFPIVSANRSTSPTHPVVATPENIPPPSVEKISSVYPPSLPEPQDPRIEPQENIRSPQDSENSKKSESSNFGDLDSVDFSPTTTNEDFENIIADKEDPQLSLFVSSEQPPAKKVQESIPPVKEIILDSPVMVTEEKNDVISGLISAQQHTEMTGVDDQFCFDSPVIEVVGSKTRVLSVHQSQPASKIGSEVEFLTHTDEFSFDERFQDSKIDSNQPNPSSDYFMFPSLLFI